MIPATKVTVRARCGLNMSDREFLERAGFRGFLSVRDLRVSTLEDAPAFPGVYVILRESAEPPLFLDRSVGGHFKGKDPSVPVDELKRQWVAESSIVYIGKAGRLGKPPTLRKRLKQYLDFGDGKLVGHWGGRLVWQLKDAEDLVVCWRPTNDEDPGDVEEKMLTEFERCHGRLPFANLKRGAKRAAL